MLNAPDVLLNGLELPRDGEAVSKKCGRHRASKDRFEIRNEPSEFIENRNDLSGVAIAVAGDCRPNDRHNRVLKKSFQLRSRLEILLNVPRNVRLACGCHGEWRVLACRSKAGENSGLFERPAGEEACGSLTSYWSNPTPSGRCYRGVRGRTLQPVR